MMEPTERSLGRERPEERGTKMSGPVVTPVKDPGLVSVRREQIVRAATALFLQNGYHKTTTREIARASGFGTGTLYEYVQCKEDILYLVCEEIHSEIEMRLNEVVTAGVTAAVQLPRLLDGFFRVIDALQDTVLLMYQETQSLPDQHLAHVLLREEKISERFANVLHRGIGDGSFSLAPNLVSLMAHNITVLGQMWAFRRWSLRRICSLDEFIETQTSLIMRELCATVDSVASPKGENR